MTEFTPVLSLIGGAIIGLSAIILLFFKGRIAGISGILNDSITKERQEILWRWLFIIGIVLGPIIGMYFGSELPAELELGWLELVIGAFLVGFGANLGNGCTSGHGICGVGRLSMRSISATLVFMTVAIVVVTIIY